MFKLSDGEKLYFGIILITLFINPLLTGIAIASMYLFKKNKIILNKMTLMLMLGVSIILTIIGFILVTINVYSLSQSNLLSLRTYYSIYFQGLIFLIVTSAVIVGVVYSYNLTYRYYNLNSTIGERMINNDFIDKEPEKSIFDKDIIRANEKMKLKEQKLRLGTSNYMKEVYVSLDTQNLFVSGTTGSGKTTAILNMVNDTLQLNKRLLYINGKGNNEDTQKVIEMCKANNREYVLFNIGIDNPVKYNPFLNADRTQIRDMLINLTDWSEEHYKANASAFYQTVLDLMSDDNITNFNIYHFVALFEDSKVLLNELNRRDMVTIKKKATAQVLQNKDVVLQSVGRIMDIFGGEGDKLLGNNGENTDILSALESNKAIIFNLNPNKYSVTTKALFRLINIDTRKAYERLDGTDLETVTFYDETIAMATEQFLNQLNQSRSSAFRNVISMQTPVDACAVLGDDFLHRIVDNCNAFLFFRVNSPKAAEYCANVIGTEERIDVTKVVDELAEGDRGTARKVHEYKVHPSSIKMFAKGEGYFLDKDTKEFHKVYCRKI